MALFYGLYLKRRTLGLVGYGVIKWDIYNQFFFLFLLRYYDTVFTLLLIHIRFFSLVHLTIAKYLLSYRILILKPYYPYLHRVYVDPINKMKSFTLSTLIAILSASIHVAAQDESGAHDGLLPLTTIPLTNGAGSTTVCWEIFYRVFFSYWAFSTLGDAIESPFWVYISPVSCLGLLRLFGSWGEECVWSVNLGARDIVGISLVLIGFVCVNLGFEMWVGGLEWPQSNCW